LLAVTLSMIWAHSVFTPWAAHVQPRLWLYDLLFYLRYVLVFWAVAEALHLAFHWNQPRKRYTLLPLVCTILAAWAASMYQHSESGMRWRVAASHGALASAAEADFSDARRRAGHFLVDSVRQPCPGQHWLWLGRPHGGGTGTNIALVRTGEQRPMTPSVDVYAFWPARGGWWFAYQHAARDHQVPAQRTTITPCAPGRILGAQRQGLSWVSDGQRALHSR
jgi:hypothetical protein